MDGGGRFLAASGQRLRCVSCRWVAVDRTLVTEGARKMERHY